MRGTLGAIALGLICTVSLGCSSSDPCAEDKPGTLCPVAGTGDTGFNQDGQGPHETDFFLITRARRGPDGLLYFMDFNNWRIRRLDGDGLIRTIAGTGFHAPAFPGAPAIESPLDNPTDFDFLPDGRLVMVSFEDPRVITIDDGIIRVLAGTGEIGTVGDEGDGFLPSQASFIELMGIAVAPDGAIYLCDSGANRVRVIRGNLITTFAGTGTPSYAGDGGPASEADLNYPTAVSFDTAGNIYIADSFNHVVRRVSPDGIIETVAGNGIAGLSGDGGAASQAQLDEPNGIASDEHGNLYIADRSNFRVRRVDPQGIITTVAGTEEGFAGAGGPATDARLGYLARLTMDGNSLLIADQSNSVILRLLLEPRWQKPARGLEAPADLRARPFG